jgi:enamine deaminase RidA (YjgF/YER057c/UK114 family)
MALIQFVHAMRFWRTLLILALVFTLCLESLQAQKKKKKRGEEEEITQTLELPKDPPQAVAVEPQRLGFLTAPMSSKGLLSQQVREGLKTLRKAARGAAIVKIRAFVAGTGDLRRVQAIVSDQFTDWKQPLPALTTIQVGGLPQEGAQVQLEAITVEKKAVNPNGLAFFSGQQVASKDVLEKIGPLFRQSLERLRIAQRTVNIEGAGVLRATCFVSALGDYGEIRQNLAQEFPNAAVTIVQTLRGLSQGLVECEAVGRASSAPASPLQAVNPPGLAPSPNYSQVMLMNAPKAVISGAQLAFNSQDSDVRLAFDRLRKGLEQAGGSLANTAVTNYYPLTQSMIEKIRQIRFEFLDKSRPPASTMLPFEGLPSQDASFAMEVITLP